MFGLRRLQSNPPRSLWLQHIHRMCCNASRPTAAPSAYFEGTHGVRFAWGNTDAIDFVAIASSLRATNGGRAFGNTNRLKAVSLVRGRKNPHSPAHLYLLSSSALAFSPPCGSCSVCEISTFSQIKYETSNRRKFETIAQKRKLNATASCECIAHISSKLHEIRNERSQSRF